MARTIVGNLKFKKRDGFDYQEFSKMIEDAYVSTRRDGKGTLKKTFSPSTVGYGHGNCPRYWFIAFTGADFDDKFDGPAIANMMNGTYAHDRLQTIIEKTGVLKEKEKEILSDDPPIRGFADLIITWGEEDVVGEIKTAKQENFDIRAASMKPSGHHLIQTLTYMKVLGLDNGFIMYENKNTQDICIIPISMSEDNSELIAKVFNWMRKVYAAWEASELPERGFSKTTYQCKNCPVRKTCWGNMEDGLIKIENLVIPK